VSLVIAYADKDKALIVSDGRAGNINEFYNKTRVINNKIILGYAGFAEESEWVLDNVINQPSINIENVSIEEFASIFHFTFSYKPEDVEFRSDFIIAGINAENKIVMYLIGALTDFKLIEEIPSPCVIRILNNDDAQPFIDDIFKHNYSMVKLPLLERFKNCITDVATIDKSVNSNFFHAEIHL
jgi:hypothetical protein